VKTISENKSKSIAPAITLILLAPLITEILPGATRFSSLFVFPIQIVVWGGGALLIRFAVRKWQLGWKGMIFLALVLSIAEEFLIQQTSVAPLVIRLKGVTYARWMDINYVYLLWALIYESVSVVIVPVFLAELIFPNRKKDIWINNKGVALFSFLFLGGCLAAWFTWTQIARTKVFHLAAYTPSFGLIAIALIAIAGLIFLATRKFAKRSLPFTQNLKPPASPILLVSGGTWSVLVYGLALLAFGIQPAFPPVIAVAIGLGLALVAVYFVPRWTNNSNWNRLHSFSLIFGVMLGSMLISFIGFIGALPKDLYFKIIVDAIAIILMIILGLKIKREAADVFSPENQHESVLQENAISEKVK
jgi:hypothetical protein